MTPIDFTICQPQLLSQKSHHWPFAGRLRSSKRRIHAIRGTRACIAATAGGLNAHHPGRGQCPARNVSTICRLGEERATVSDSRPGSELLTRTAAILLQPSERVSHFLFALATNMSRGRVKSKCARIGQAIAAANMIAPMTMAMTIHAFWVKVPPREMRIPGNK